MPSPKPIQIPDIYIQEARAYSSLARRYTSDRHDFHDGWLDEKERKMFEGKLWEKIVKMFLIENSRWFQEDPTDYTQADEYDFVLADGTTIDVKTRTQPYHTRTLEMCEQLQAKPKDIYISVRLFPERYAGYIIWWCTSKDLVDIGHIENQGYLDNYVLYDRELRSVESLVERLHGTVSI
jgi:hypothetical protein